LSYEIPLGQRPAKAAREKWLAAIANQRSHHIYGKSGSVIRLSVPVHGNQPLKTGLLRHLLKMAGLNEENLRND